MRQNGLAPDGRAYTRALTACELMGDATQAFVLYHQACDDGVVPVDEMHNVLVRVCSKTHRIEEALNLVKDLMRNHGNMEYHTLNSITRALCEDYIGAHNSLFFIQADAGHSRTILCVLLTPLHGPRTVPRCRHACIRRPPLAAPSLITQLFEHRRA